MLGALLKTATFTNCKVSFESVSLHEDQHFITSWAQQSKPAKVLMNSEGGKNWEEV